MGWIYKIVNELSGKCYVGQTRKSPDHRWRCHRYAANRWIKYRKGWKSAISCAIALHGESNFTFSIIEECEDSSLNEREMHWIRELDSNVTNGGYGYNLDPGGRVNPPSIAPRGRPHTSEAKQKIKLAHLGRSHVGWRKVPYSSQEKQNKSKAADHQKVKIERLTFSGESIQLHDSLSAAVEWLIENGLASKNTGATNLKQGAIKNRTRYGFRWKLHE